MKKNVDNTRTRRGNDRIFAAILVLCAIVVGFWEIMSRASLRPFDALALNAADFGEFRPESDRWYFRDVPVSVSMIAPAIVAYEMRGKSANRLVAGPSKSSAKDGFHSPDLTSKREAPGIPGPVLVRLMHGFNVVDCMRIKQYRVELIRDDRTTDLHPAPPRVQVWRLTAPDGEKSVWVTSMLRATDFMETGVDARDMAFPRVGTPDAPSWNPTGLKWSSFRHPIKNLHQIVRARWNASRCDLLTFLRLRRPVWVSDEVLTLVGEYRGSSVEPEQESDVTACVLSAQQLLLHHLQKFRATMTQTE